MQHHKWLWFLNKNLYLYNNVISLPKEEAFNTILFWTQLACREKNQTCFPFISERRLDITVTHTRSASQIRGWGLDFMLYTMLINFLIQSSPWFQRWFTQFFISILTWIRYIGANKLPLKDKLGPLGKGLTHLIQQNSKIWIISLEHQDKERNMFGVAQMPN